MTPTPPVLRQLVARVYATHPGEMECGDCDVRLDRFAEMTLAGLDAREALPLVEEHLQMCPCCREEFEGLMEVLRAAEREGRPWWRRWRR